MKTSRAEHLEWCKRRALEILEAGDVEGAFTSMASDLGKHPETREHPAIQLGTMLMMTANLSTEKKMSDFIAGFN